MDRTMPRGWYVKTGHHTQFFADFGRALGFAAHGGGNVYPAFALRAPHETA